MSASPSIDALEECWASFDALIGDLTPEQWATPSLCAGWAVRDVVIHLGAIEYLLSGERPGSMTESVPFAKAGEWTTRVRDLDDVALLAAYREVIDTRRDEVAALTVDDLAQASMTPVGPGTVGRFLDIRVFDFWVHEQDVRVPLAMPGHEAGPAAEMAIDEIRGSLPYIIGKKVGLPDGMGVTIEVTGPVERTMHVRVAGRAAVVDALEAPDVTLRADSTTFALLACGRIDPQGPLDDGRITFTGDAVWGDNAARRLAFTM